MNQNNNYVCKNCKLSFNLDSTGTILCPRCYSSKVKKQTTKNLK